MAVEGQNGKQAEARNEERKNKMNATTTQFETVRKSSAKCAEYNAANQEAIDAGLVLPQQPDEATLRCEKQDAERAAALELRRAKIVAVLAELETVNPGKVALGIEEEYGAQSTWSRGAQTGWKLIIGSGYGRDANKKWMRIGEGCTLLLTDKQLEKAKDKIAEVAEVAASEKAKWNAKQSVEARTTAFIKANEVFCKMVGHSYYNSGETVYFGSGYNKQARYQTAFLVNVDGTIKIGHETFTMSQWIAIYELRAAQAEAMQALKASFKGN